MDCFSSSPQRFTASLLYRFMHQFLMNFTCHKNVQSKKNTLRHFLYAKTTGHVIHIHFDVPIELIMEGIVSKKKAYLA